MRSIAHIVPHVGHGGDWTVVRTLLQLQAADGCALWLNAEAGGKLPSGVSVHAVPVTLNTGWGGVWRGQRVLDAWPRDLDVLHAHSPIALAYAATLRRRRCKGARVIFTYHWPVPESGLRTRLKRLVLARADAIHCPSPSVARDLRERYKLPDARLHCIPLGIDSARFRPRPIAYGPALRRLFGLPEDALVLGFLGRLATEKNVGWILDWLQARRERWPQVHLGIAGAGDLKPALEAQISQQGLQGRVHFVGRINNPEDFFPALDLHVLPSRFEAFALTVMEAAFCETPTLRSDTEGAAEQIDDGRNGYVFALAGGQQAFFARLDAALEEHTRWPELGRAARERARALCDVSVFHQSMLKLYRGEA